MKKVLYIFRIISIIIILFLAALVFIPNILGITPTIDLLGTMKPKISKGSISYVNERYKYKNLNKNDVIEIKKYNQKIMVRIQSKNEKNNTLTVKGDAESKEDTIIISNKEYLGKYIFSIPKVGLIVLFLQRNFFLTILLIIIIVVSLIIDYIDYKKIDVTQGIKINKGYNEKIKEENSTEKVTITEETTIKDANNEEKVKNELKDKNKEENKKIEILDVYNENTNHKNK